MILVFTGKGKGKTTAALGIGLRAVGAGKKVLVIQFLKSGDSSEVEAIEEIDGFEIKSFGKKGFFVPQSELEETGGKNVQPLGPENEQRAREALDFAVREAENYDVIILDEINLALHYDLLEEQETLSFVEDCSAEVILTGRHCPDSVEEEADLVTECKEVKHYYHQGQGPIKGIDL